MKFFYVVDGSTHSTTNRKVAAVWLKRGLPVYVLACPLVGRLQGRLP